MKTQVENDGSGLLMFRSGRLSYQRADREVWAFDLGAVRLIGEHTTDHGPYVDDYHVYFAVGRPAQFYEAPMYAGSDLMETLSHPLGSTVIYGLCNRTDFASRVIWPPELEGLDLFDFKPTRRKAGPVNWLLDRVFPLITRELTEDVRRFLDCEGAA